MSSSSVTHPLTTTLSPWTCTKTIFKHELRQRVYNVSTTIFLSGMLLFLTACIFLVGDFLDTNLAILTLQWQFLPWISIIFVPALAMRAFQGKGLGDVGLILSYPIPTYSTIVGKWLAGVVILACLLFLTFPFAITAGLLGEPDWGIALAGYAAALLAMSLLYAIAILAAAICKEEISSFLLGAAFITFLLFVDTDALQTSLIPNSFQNFSHYLYTFSPKHWMDEMATGHIDLSAITYFVLFTILCLALSCYQLGGFYSTKRRPYFLFIAGVFGLLFASFTAGIIANAIENLNVNFDVSEHREYTLRPETVSIATTSPAETKITLYLSKDKNAIPPKIIQHINRVERAIINLSKQSHDKIDFSVIALEPDTEVAEIAEVAGIRKIPMSSGDFLYFGAVFTTNSKRLVTSYFDYNRASSLEYDLALQLSNLAREKTPQVGILSSVLKPNNITIPHPGLSILDELKSQYDVSIIPYFSDGLTDQYDVLIIMDAPVIRKATLKDIDRHIQAGKGTIIILDPFQRMNSANANLTIKSSKEGQINSITDLLQNYGLYFSSHKIVGDFKNAATVESTTGQNFAYPYWLQIQKNDISQTHLVSETLNELLFVESGYFKANKSSIKIEPIVTTSDETNLISKNEAQENSTEELATSFKVTEKKRRIIAAHLSGNLNSPFVDLNDLGIQSSASVFAIADADWLYNGFSLADARMGDRVFSQPINDNHKLFLNMVEYISGDPRLTKIRSRKSPIRTFSSIEKMLFENRKLYHNRETAYAARINNTDKSIAKVLEMTGAKSIEDLPSSLKQKIKNLRLAAYPIKRELREIRLAMREGINNQFKTITLVNLLSGPILALFAFLFVRRFRRIEG